MKIYSKFRDYYDIGLAHGVDNTIHYVRKEEKIKNFNIPDIEKISDRKYRWRGPNYLIRSNYSPDEWPHVDRGNSKLSSIALFFVGFCGKLYPGYKFVLEKKVAFASEYIYSIDALDRFLNKHIEIKKIVVEYHRGKWLSSSSTYNDLIKIFKEFKHGNIDNVFFELKSPVFYWNSDRQNVIIVNPHLNGCRFQKAVDPYTAYQEISMYKLNDSLLDLDLLKLIKKMSKGAISITKIKENL